MMNIKQINEKQNKLKDQVIDLNQRLKLLNDLKQMLINNEEILYDALLKDLNKSKKETFLCEINEIILEINYHLKHLKKWIKPKKVKSTIQTFNTKSYLLAKPKGKVIIISPFNYPLNLAFMPLIGAISAGNQVLLKPSPYTIHTNQILKKIINETFDPMYISIILDNELNSYDEIYDYHPQLIFFTGSTKIGKIIENECVKRNIHYVTELGGMCPCFVDEINTKTIYDRIIWAKFLNAGQTCVSINHLFYNSNIKNFKSHLIEALKNQYNDVLNNKQIVKIINENEFKRLTSIINKNKQNIIYGGKCNSKNLLIEPTIIEIKINEIKQYQELFGPILFICKYNEQDFIKTLNLNNEIDNSPLAAYLMSSNKQKIKTFFNLINAGSYCINDAISQILNHNLPFGGVFNSGNGYYHGYYSFKTMSYIKPLLYNPNKKDIPIKYINNQINYEKTKKLLSFLTKFKH